MKHWIRRERLCGQGAEGIIQEWSFPCTENRQDVQDLDLSEFTWWGWEHPWNLRRGSGDRDSADNPRTLGLHWAQGSIRTSHFVGAVRLGMGPNAPPIIVDSRVSGLDIATVFGEVLALPRSVTGVDLDLLFGCDVEQDPIEGVVLPDLTLLEIIAYLSCLSRFIHRHLRRGFVRVRDNLVGKVRGRILISAQVRENLSRARDDRMVCDYMIHSLDTLENRILKAALEVSSRWLARQSLSTTLTITLHQWSAMARVALSAVPEYRVNPRDWAVVRKVGLMSAYAQPLTFARLVLTRLSLSPRGAAQEDSTHRTLPFYLDANRLFEGWVGVCLHHAGYTPDPQEEKTFPNMGPGNGPWRFRPDFVLHQNCRVVVDAKYKPGGIKVSDLYQAIGYARLLAIPGESQQGECSGGEDGYPEAWLAVPDLLLVQDSAVARSRFEQIWQQRNYGQDQAANAVCWRDGLRLGVVKVPLPRRPAPVAADHF